MHESYYTKARNTYLSEQKLGRHVGSVSRLSLLVHVCMYVCTSLSLHPPTHPPTCSLHIHISIPSSSLHPLQRPRDGNGIPKMRIWEGNRLDLHIPEIPRAAMAITVAPPFLKTPNRAQRIWDMLPQCMAWSYTPTYLSIYLCMYSTSIPRHRQRQTDTNRYTHVPICLPTYLYARTYARA